MKRKKDGLIIIKIGSSVLLSSRNKLDDFRIQKLAWEIRLLRARGKKIVLVISGAVALGSSYSKQKRLTSNRAKQEIAAVGQAYLTSSLWNIFKKQKQTIAQILLTKEDLNNEKSKIKQLILSLLEKDYIPALNENDVVKLNCFGGNDYLAAEIAKLTKADRLIILTDVEGVIESFGEVRKSKQKVRAIPVVKKVTKKIKQLAKPSLSKNGVGGMKAKIEIAEKLMQCKIKTTIVNGKKQNILKSILIENKQIGTTFARD